VKRFVVLRHEMPQRPLHWDFMLEMGDALRTWALDAEPAGSLSITATALADHRAIYLEYEGPISGDRGQVTRWDWGDCQFLKDEDDQIVARLEGQKLNGEVILQRDAEHDQRWIFRFSA
jgi:hypothetical protein